MSPPCPTPELAHLRLPHIGTPAPETDAQFAEHLFQLYGAYVATIAHRILGGNADVDDVVQDVFAVVIRKPRLVRGLAAPRQWLAAVAVKRARQILRGRRVRMKFIESTASDHERAHWGPARPGASPEAGRLLVQLYRALNLVTPDERVAWVLRHLEGESVEDAAKIVGCSERTIKRRAAFAHAVVRKHFGEAGE